MKIVLRVYRKKGNICSRKSTKSQYKQEESVAWATTCFLPLLSSLMWFKLHSKWMGSRMQGSLSLQLSDTDCDISTGEPRHKHFSSSSGSVLQRLNSRQVWPRRQGIHLLQPVPLTTQSFYDKHDRWRILELNMHWSSLFVG